MADDSNRPESGDEFREAMPATAEYFAMEAPERPATDDSKFFAVVTLVLVALVVIALGLLFLRGLDIIKTSVPAQQQQQQQPAQPLPQSDSSGTLEL